MRYLNNQGCDYGERGDYYNAYLKFKESAEMGNAVAEYNLACFYWEGKYVASNPNIAVQYFLKSARKGFVPAMYWYGKYLLDCGGYSDRNEAISWLQRAAYRGSGDAAQLLRQMQEQERQAKINQYREAQERAQQYYEELQERLLQSRQDTASTQVRSSTSGRKKPRRGTGSSSSPGYLPPEKKNDAGSQDALVRPKDVEKL